MKVLRLCNLMLPEFEPAFPGGSNPCGGWMSGLLRQLEKNSKIELGVCFPVYFPFMQTNGAVKAWRYFTFFKQELVGYDAMVERFKEVLSGFQPDTIHIWGTEYPHSSAMADACEQLSLLSRAVIHIQGLASAVAKHYFADIPQEYLTWQSEWGQSLETEGSGFAARRESEYRLLQRIRHVMGRTDWDRACALQANPDVQYHFCGEILRDAFYERQGQWDVGECERYSIFVSQAEFPIKGLHYLLRALPTVMERFPGVHVYVGRNIPQQMNPYGHYLADLLREFHLENKVTFLGLLQEAEMAERFLRSHVFVSASSIENSSNSVCEAMLLGVPVVSSYVGGVANLLSHPSEGFLYQHNAEYMLAYYICRIFENAGLAAAMSKKAAAKMRSVVDRELNAARIAAIYQEIGQSR